MKVKIQFFYTRKGPVHWRRNLAQMITLELQAMLRSQITPLTDKVPRLTL